MGTGLQTGRMIEESDSESEDGTASEDSEGEELRGLVEAEARAELSLPVADGGRRPRVQTQAEASREDKFAKALTVAEYQVAKEQAEGAAPRLEALDAPRWIASVCIVCSHFLRQELGTFATWGGTWTQFFFVLSGFVLGYVEMARPAAKKEKLTQLQYVHKRLVTIYPTYIFAVVVALANRTHTLIDWATLPLHICLMQSWLPWIIPVWYGTTKGWELSTWRWAQTSWFLSVLVVFWFFLRPLARMMRQLSLVMTIVVLVGCWMFSAFGCLAAWTKDDTGMSEVGQLCVRGLWQFCWTGYLHVFIYGVATARLLILTSMKDAKTGLPPAATTQSLALDKERAPFLFRYGCCAGYLIYLLLVFLCPEWVTDSASGLYLYWPIHNGGIMPVMMLILLGGAIGADPLARYVFRSRPFLVLGRISYAQYLLQYSVHYIVEGNVPDQNARYAVFPVALTAASYLTERFFTAVYTEWVRWRQEKGMQGCDELAVESLDKAIDRCFGRHCCCGLIKLH